MARESLSALLDGECTPAEMDRLLAELESSPELMREWTRLCVAREAREGTRIAQDQRCICAAVMSALDDLPAEAPNPRVVELAPRRKAFWNPLAGIAANGPAAAVRPLAGLAVAASVAVVALMVSLPSHRQDAVGSASAGGSGLVPQAITSPVSLPLLRRGGRNLQSVALRTQDAEQQEELDKLLLEHNGSMAEQGMGGTLRYARFAAHSAEYRPQEAVPGDQP